MSEYRPKTQDRTSHLELEEILGETVSPPPIQNDLRGRAPQSLDEHMSEHDYLVFGIKGAGFNSNPGNAALIGYMANRGTMASEGEVRRALRRAVQAERPTRVHLFGYSRGGNAVIDIARDYARYPNLEIEITTIDPHRYMGQDFEVPENVQGQNYFQRNPTTSTGWRGIRNPIGLGGDNFNPFMGSRVHGANIQNFDASAATFGHNNIVGDALGAQRGAQPYDPELWRHPFLDNYDLPYRWEPQD